MSKSEVVKKIELVLIDGPKKDQRIEINQETVEELAASIGEIGLMQPILLTPKNGRYEIVWGHRRYLAHKFLGKTNILAKVQTLDQDQIIIMRATENLFREGITPIEEAYIYQDLKETRKMTIDQIAKRMKKSAGVVRRRLDLLRMPECLQRAIHSRKLKYAVAEDLWSLGDLSSIEYYLQFAIEHGATSAVVRQWVRDERDKKRREASGTDEGGGTISVNEYRPTYVACDVCKEPMELGKETVIRSCKVCTKGIMEAIEGAV
jgi:ParB family chromosome partitioning protein